MDIKMVQLVDQYMVSNRVVQTLNTGDLELLRKLLYKAITFKPDAATLRMIFSYCTKVFKGKRSFSKDLRKFSSCTFDLLLAKQLASRGF